MGFFVEENSQQQKQWQESNEKPEQLGIELLALGKRAGLSFAEINEFRTQDLLDYVRAYAGAPEAKEERPRIATQEDIDRFYSGL